ncbi:MAG: glycoside hydrolase family protein, partial [Alphaproteobacteria bacterium]
AEFRKWVWTGGRKLEGLVRRREAEVSTYKRRIIEEN